MGSSISSTVRRCDVLIYFCGLFLFFLWVDLLWHAIDRRPPRWDESHAMTISQHSYQALQRGQLLTALSLKGVSDTKPGMVPFLSAITYFIVGDSPVVATMMVNGAVMLIVLYVLLRASSDLYGSAAIGAVAFLVFCNTRAVLIWSGYYQPDMPLTAVVCATVWLCWTIDRKGLEHKWPAAMLGLSIGVGMGIKHLYPVFVAGPIALLICRSVFAGGRPLRAAFRRRGFLFGCIAAGIAAGVLYHLLNFHVIREQFTRFNDASLTGGIGSPPDGWDVFRQLLSFMPASAWCALLAVSSIWAFAMRRWRIAYVLLCVFGGYLGVSRLASWPMPYYYMPVIPLGFLVAGGFLGLPLPLPGPVGKRVGTVRTVVLAALAVTLLLEYSEQRLGTRNLVRVARRTPLVLSSFGRWTANPMSDDEYWRVKYVDGNVPSLPYPHNWPVAEMVQQIADSMALCPPRRPLQILYFTGAYEWMSDELARYQLKRMRLQDTLRLCQLYTFPEDRTPSQILADYDFVILKTGRAMKNEIYGAPWAEAYQTFVNRLTADGYAVMSESGFKLLKRWDLPDGSEGSVWGRCSQRADPEGRQAN